MCVHDLPLLFLLTLFLFEHLAEHMLLEFAACLNGEIWENNKWSEEDKEWMKQSIVYLWKQRVSRCAQLMLIKRASKTYFQSSKWARRSDGHGSSVSKHHPSKASELGPIHKINFMSSAKRDACAVKKCTDASEMDGATAEVQWLEEVSPEDLVVPFLNITTRDTELRWQLGRMVNRKSFNQIGQRVIVTSTDYKPSLLHLLHPTVVVMRDQLM